MRVLVAPDCFTGTLTAPEAARAITRGWLAGAPGDTVEQLPLADGGPGFVHVLHAALGGELGSVTVTGPLGETVPGTVLLVPGPDGPTAYVESAQAVGLDLVPEDRRDPTRTTSRGLGELVRAAREAGARRIVVGVGGTATNDGGAGLLAGLGGADGPAAELLGGGGGGLEAVTAETLEGLGALAHELADVELVGAVDVDVTLLGLHGASAGFAPQKGATPEQAQQLERALGHFAHLAQRVVAQDGPPRLRHLPLLAADAPGHPGHSHSGHGHAGHSHAGGDAARLASLPGAGAGGGIGFAIALLGGRLVPGARVVADAVGLGQRIAGVDLVVTGEGTFDWQSLRGKVVSMVAEAALDHAVPTVVLAGQVEIGRREWSAAGISGAYAVAESPAEVPDVLADPVTRLEERAARLGRNWSH